MNEIRAVARARFEAAAAFAEVADLIRSDAESSPEVPTMMRSVYVTLAVHSGIAAADALCAIRLGRYSNGARDHRDAVDLLTRVDKKLSISLGRLVRLKTPAGYTPKTLSLDDVQTATRAMDALLEAARAAAPPA